MEHKSLEFFTSVRWTIDVYVCGVKRWLCVSVCLSTAEKQTATACVGSVTCKPVEQSRLPMSQYGKAANPLFMIHPQEW